MTIAGILQKHSKNNVLVLEDVKSANYPLYKYCVNNLDTIEKALSESGVYLIKKGTKLDYDKAKFLIHYYYGSTVNVSTLYRQHKTIYNFLTSLDGKVSTTLKGMGFELTNNRDLSLIRKLKSISKDGHIDSMDRNTYNKVYYQASKMGITVTEYLKGHGLTYKLNGCRDGLIKEMYEQGIKLNEIAKNTNTSKSTVCRVLRKEKENTNNG